MSLFGSLISHAAFDFTNISNALYTGDSIAVGQNSTAGNSYREKLNAEFFTTTQQLAVGARGVWREIANLHPTGFTRDETVIFMEGGLNDLRRSADAKTTRKIEVCLLSCLKKAFSSASVVNGGNAAVTRTGTHTTFDAASLGGVNGNDTIPGTGATFTSTNGGTWTWSFTGTNVYIVSSGSSGANARGDFEVRIDTVLVDTVTDLDACYDGVSDGDYDNLRGPYTKVYWDLAPGAHTIEIRNITTSPVPIDQIGVLDDPANCGYVILIQIPKVVDYAKPGLDQASDALLDAADVVRKNIIAPFRARGYRVFWLPIMQGEGGLYDRSVGTDTADDVHPNNTGHDQIFRSLKVRIHYP